MATSPPPSAALVRTARKEIARIDRALLVIERRRTALLAQLAELDNEAHGYGSRKALLEQLAYVEQVIPTASAQAARGRVVRGAELRRVAARLLWSIQRDREIYYREWFERVIAEGYTVGGKDPAASFLTNIRDSPAVRRGSTQGHYGLDRHALDRTAQELEETRAELADLERSIARAYAETDSSIQLESLRGHRDHLNKNLKHLDAKLGELRYVFEDHDDHAKPEAEVHAVKALRAA